MNTSRRSGFTLIELLVVIAIIAILAAILFPVFTSAKEKGRMTSCLSNLKNLSMAFRMYADSNGGRLPCSFSGWDPNGSDWCGCVNPGYADGVQLEKGAIWNYAGKNKRIFACPTDANMLTTSWNMRTKSKNYPISYAMNYWLGPPAARPAIDALRSPSKVLLLIHEGRNNIDDGCFAWAPNNTNGLNLPSNVHYGGSTVSYVDGHAKWASYETLLKEQDSNRWNPTL